MEYLSVHSREFLVESPAALLAALAAGSFAFVVLTRWLEEFQPDVVGLQELKCTDEAFPHEAIEALATQGIVPRSKAAAVLAAS